MPDVVTDDDGDGGAAVGVPLPPRPDPPLRDRGGVPGDAPARGVVAARAATNAAAAASASSFGMRHFTPPRGAAAAAWAAACFFRFGAIVLGCLRGRCCALLRGGEREEWWNRHSTAWRARWRPAECTGAA